MNVVVKSIFVWSLLLVLLSQRLCHAQIRSRGMTNQEAQQITENVAKDFVPLIGPIVIKNFNDPPRDLAAVTKTSPIDIVVGDSRVSPVPGVYSNCVADSTRRLIQCDLRLLDDLIDDYALLKIEYETNRNKLREKLLRLILAHELGHVALHHPSAAYHGQKDGFSIFKYTHYRIELEADAFAVKLIDRLNGDVNGYYVVIAELADAAVRKSLCPHTFPEMCPCPGYTDATLCSRMPIGPGPLGPGLLIGTNNSISVELTGTHPALVVRLARILYLARDQDAELRYYADRARQVLLRVVVRNEHGRLESTADLFK